eukprot:TRINITY_DN8499_c3_g1_i1.p1 TRINITY_DN8499_c3_g1~~TRINITY_DN8499_c3_g1_i1.p1  ORF type:complete len:376 (+),score=33.06 TRINITY_DN8499_c3_g1_i1:92-1129(+)
MAREEMSAEQRTKYQAIFRQNKDQAMHITGQAARALFERSGADKRALFQIWNMADMDGDGLLDVDEFSIAVHLMTQYTVKGHELPPSVPPGLLPPNKRPSAPPPQAESQPSAGGGGHFGAPSSDPFAPPPAGAGGGFPPAPADAFGAPADFGPPSDFGGGGFGAPAQPGGGPPPLPGDPFSGGGSGPPPLPGAGGPPPLSSDTGMGHGHGGGGAGGGSSLSPGLGSMRGGGGGFGSGGGFGGFGAGGGGAMAGGGGGGGGGGAGRSPARLARGGGAPTTRALVRSSMFATPRPRDRGLGLLLRGGRRRGARPQPAAGPQGARREGGGHPGRAVEGPPVPRRAHWC